MITSHFYVENSIGSHGGAQETLEQLQIIIDY